MPAEDAIWIQFTEKLEAHHRWPCSYVFKCVVPTPLLAEARTRLPEGEVTLRESQGGKYTALTCVFQAGDAGAVVSIYRGMSGIEGIILL